MTEPRIAPLAVDRLSDDLLTIIAPMIAVNAALDSREAGVLTDLVDGNDTVDRQAQMAELPEIMRTMLRHPALFASHAAIGIELLARGALPPRDRELAILRTAWLCRAPYEFGEHVIIAKKAGLTSAEIDAVKQGSGAPGWAAHDRAILLAAEELRADATISDATWAVLATRYDERQLIELPILVGQYQAVAYYQNALRLRLHEGNDGLDAR